MTSSVAAASLARKKAADDDLLSELDDLLKEPAPAPAPAICRQQSDAGSADLDALLADLSTSPPKQRPPTYASSSRPQASATGGGGGSTPIRFPTSGGSNDEPGSRCGAHRCYCATLCTCARATRPPPCRSLRRRLRCSRCDFKVLLFEDSAWAKTADYMFFRNHVPNRAKLAERLESADGRSAYACQCSWSTIDAWRGKVPHDYWFKAALG
jgi:hypothetical protein